MNILIVKYLPSGEKSNTLKLLNFFKTSINRLHKVTELDLLKDMPTSFDEASLLAYKKRNYGGVTLTDAESKTLENQDRLTSQFMQADVVVLATPMHNFSLPGIVKVYFDNIMQSGKVFKYVNDQQIGLMPHKKFVTLYTSMGSYKGEFGFLDNLKALVKIELDFMGITNQEYIHASTGNEATRAIHFENASKGISALIDKWKL